MLNKIYSEDPNIGDWLYQGGNREFTLQKGTYVINFSAPAHRANQHNCWLWNDTDGVKVAQGTAEWAGFTADG